ncbi:hypothetical protein [uncultured Tenacibaculum sp.]|uniref:hypothetical protein n=1 Tax=uncultured Tenacibaculum sp. TaxID=174713 RepID=UPI00263A2185|nr:hypothetical protein [uncultured Tenacibaculum sp.]
MKIAEDKTILDWNELSQKLDIDKDYLWSCATSFFEKRVNSRYILPIKAIQKLNINKGEGFAVVSLQCSLIETFECFINGWLFFYDNNRYLWENIQQKRAKYKNDNLNNQRIFKSFFDNFNNDFNGIDGKYFYTNIRCGLLHETQTKNNWLIKSETPYDLCYQKLGKSHIIYRNNLQKKIEQLLKDYQQALINNTEFRGVDCKTLRSNFIKKFDHLAKQS